MLWLLPVNRAWSAPTFVTDTGVRIASAAPQAVAGAYPALRLYFLRGSTQALSAVTADGLTFTAEAGLRLSTTTQPAVDAAAITGLSILPLDAGGWRMLYSAVGADGLFRIFSATSADGLGWANEAGTRITADGGNTYLARPSLVKLAGGDWRVYYIQDRNGGNQSADRRVFTSLSVDQGATWIGGSLALNSQTESVATSTSPLTDGRVRLYYTSSLAGETTRHLILSAVSADSQGTSLARETEVRLSTGIADGAVSDPLVVRSTDHFRWRMYFGLSPLATAGDPVQRSAVTDSPDPQFMNPNLVLKANAAVRLEVRGEVFSPGAAASLVRTGEADIVGTAVTRQSDQSLLATFDIARRPTGLWGVAVTNANGRTGQRANALRIDFERGTVTVTDNLLRPREGRPAKIEIKLFDPGRVTAGIFTIGGRPVATLLDADLSEGTFTFTWDGKSAPGAAVPSGVYLLRVVGPRLNELSKIVVIR